jgi:DNA-binding PadR family transcriptional regulator
MEVDALSVDLLLLLALTDGPAAGSEIAERARTLTGDPRVLGAGTLYPALRRLQSAGVVRSWVESERSRVGRPRRFNELTAAGVQVLARQRSLLQALAATAEPAKPSRGAVERMRANLRRAFALSALGARLSAAVARRPGGRHDERKARR